MYVEHAAKTHFVYFEKRCNCNFFDQSLFKTFCSGKSLPIGEGLPGWRLFPGCQLVYFQTKNPDLGTFWRALDWKMMLYFMIIWDILRPFGIIYGRLL
jgi:hypothetical protein